jgi:hypothetical protein
MQRCHLKKTSDDIITLSRSSKTANNINWKLFENANLPVFAFFSKIIRFYFIGVFPDFLDTLYGTYVFTYVEHRR